MFKKNTNYFYGVRIGISLALLSEMFIQIGYFSKSYVKNKSGCFFLNTVYDTIRYDSVYLTCSKKLTGSQLSLPHGINKKLKCETKN